MVTKLTFSKSSQPKAPAPAQSSIAPKPDGSLFGSSQNPAQPQLQQFQEQPGRFLDPSREMQRQSSFSQAEATQQLGLSALASQFGAGLGQSAQASQARADAAKAMDERQRNPLRTVGGTQRVTKGNPNATNAFLANRNQERMAAQERLGASQLSGQNFMQELMTQRQQQGSAERQTKLQTGAQLGSAMFGAQGNVLSSLFGSISVGGGGGRYW